MAVKFFGQFLIERGEIDAAQLHDALALMNTENKQLGEIGARDCGDPHGRISSCRYPALKALAGPIPENRLAGGTDHWPSPAKARSRARRAGPS